MTRRNDLNHKPNKRKIHFEQGGNPATWRGRSAYFKAKDTDDSEREAIEHGLVEYTDGPEGISDHPDT